MSSKVPPVRLATGVYLEPGLDWASRALWLKIFTLFAIAVFVGVCVVVSEVRPAALVDGIPRMLGWMATAWPPYGQELDVIAYRAFETVAIATVGTLVAALLAAPLSVLISNNISPMGKFAWPVRWLCNACRGIDTVVFAILFVAGTASEDSALDPKAGPNVLMQLLLQHTKAPASKIMLLFW